jgi:hypothetical protein
MQQSTYLSEKDIEEESALIVCSLITLDSFCISELHFLLLVTDWSCSHLLGVTAKASAETISTARIE